MSQVKEGIDFTLHYGTVSQLPGTGTYVVPTRSFNKIHFKVHMNSPFKIVFFSLNKKQNMASKGQRPSPLAT